MSSSSSSSSPPPSTSTITQPCAVCANRHAPFQCSRCSAISYCSRECQRVDWKATHKAVCSPPARILELLGCSVDDQLLPAKLAELFSCPLDDSALKMDEKRLGTVTYTNLHALGLSLESSGGTVTTVHVYSGHNTSRYTDFGAFPLPLPHGVSLAHSTGAKLVAQLGEPSSKGGGVGAGLAPWLEYTHLGLLVELAAVTWDTPHAPIASVALFSTL